MSDVKPHEQGKKKGGRRVGFSTTKTEPMQLIEVDGEYVVIRVKKK